MRCMPRDKFFIWHLTLESWKSCSPFHNQQADSVWLIQRIKKPETAEIMPLSSAPKWLNLQTVLGQTKSRLAETDNSSKRAQNHGKAEPRFHSVDGNSDKVRNYTLYTVFCKYFMKCKRKSKEHRFQITFQNESHRKNCCVEKHKNLTWHLESPSRVSSFRSTKMHSFLNASDFCDGLHFSSILLLFMKNLVVITRTGTLFL